VRPEGEQGEQGHLGTTPHVSNDRWYGTRPPDDKRYHMDHGFPHGCFERFCLFDPAFFLPFAFAGDDQAPRFGKRYSGPFP